MILYQVNESRKYRNYSLINIGLVMKINLRS